VPQHFGGSVGSQIHETTKATKLHKGLNAKGLSSFSFVPFVVKFGHHGCSILEAMKRIPVRIVTLLFLLTLPALFAVEKQYEAGKILDVQQKARTRTLYYLVNTPVTRDEPYYELTVQVKDIVYVAEYTPRHSADTLPDDWHTGTEIQLKADKRHLLVKRPGEAQADLVVVKHMPVASWKAPQQDPPAEK